MARFFKFIFHMLLICYIAVILALVVPPLVGFTTATTLENTSGNQAVGTVDYAKRTPLNELKIGDRILVTATDTVNVYTVQSVDVDQSVVTVASTETKEIPVRSYVYKMILAVPVIGYVIIALQSMEGIIVLAMIAVLLLLLCILTSVWSKKVKESRRKQKELEAERRAAEKKAAEEKERRKSAESERSDDRRAEAYFAARQAELNRPAPDEEYEDFPPKEKTPAKSARPVEAQQKVAEAKPDAELDYFDDDEDDENVDFWLHDDVDDEDLFEGLNSRAASESLMATARLFAINRAAQAKEKIAAGGSREAVDHTKVVVPGAIVQPVASTPKPAETKLTGTTKPVVASVSKSVAAVAPAVEKTTVAAPKSENKVKSAPVKELTVDKVVSLKELQELEADTQQIVLTINIKVVSE